MHARCWGHCARSRAFSRCADALKTLLPVSALARPPSTSSRAFTNPGYPIGPYRCRPSSPTPAVEAPSGLDIFPETCRHAWCRGVRLTASLVPRVAGVGAYGAAEIAPGGNSPQRYRGVWRLVGLRDRPNLTHYIDLNASAFVDIDMGNSRVFLHIDIR
jgi:hypothetical protein